MLQGERMEKTELLEKPVWTYVDVMFYCNVRKSKAYEIIAICKKELNGTVRFNPHGVKRDSVLQYLGTDIERETYISKSIHKSTD